MVAVLTKKHLSIATILLSAFTLFLCYEYMWGALASRTKPPQPDFEISASPETVFIYSWEGSSNATVIKVKSISGFSGTVKVKLGYTYIIGDVRLILDSSELTLRPGGQASCLLTLYTITPVHPGQYYVYVVGNADNIEHSVRVIVVVAYESL